MSYMFLCGVGEGHFLQEVPPTASDSGPSLCPGIFPSDLKRPLTYFPKQISSFPPETQCWPPPTPSLLWIFVPGCEHHSDGDSVCPQGRHRPGQEQSWGQIQGCSYRVPQVPTGPGCAVTLASCSWTELCSPDPWLPCLRPATHTVDGKANPGAPTECLRSRHPAKGGAGATDLDLAGLLPAKGP